MPHMSGFRREWISEAINTHEKGLIRYATWLLGDLESAREVVQETYLKLCREDPAKIDDHIAAWLFTVCRNLAYDRRKKETRMVPIGDDDLASATDAQPRPLAVLEQKQALGQIQQIIETLPKNQREVVYLKFQSDLSYKEIASVTRLSVSNVGFLLHTALKTIRERVPRDVVASTTGRFQ